MVAAVSRDNPVPLYKQVKARIFELLYGGELPALSKVPSERELVDQLGVSRITVRQALTELVQEGHLTAQPGKGFYATGNPGNAYELELLRSFTQTALAHGKRPGSRTLALEVIDATPDIARSLRLGAGAKVVSLRRLRLIDDTPVAIAHDWISLALVPDLAGLDWDSGNRSLYAELQNRYGLVPFQGETLLSAALANDDDARLLGLTPPTAVLTVMQRACDKANRPINLTHTIHHPTAYPLKLDQGPR